MLTKPVDSYPDWIPRCLVLELARYDQLAQLPIDDVSRSLFPCADAEQAMLHRIIDDQSMQRVWRNIAIQCSNKFVNFERFAYDLWLEMMLANQTVIGTKQTRSQRTESLSEAGKKLRQLARLLMRHDETRIESNHLLSEMYAARLQQLQPNANNVIETLTDGAEAWAVLVSEVDTKRTISSSDALGAALSISLTDVMEFMANRLDALQGIAQEVKHVGKPLPIFIRRLNVFFKAAFNQPMDDTVAEIVNSALVLPSEKMLDRTSVRAYTEKKID